MGPQITVTNPEMATSHKEQVVKSIGIKAVVIKSEPKFIKNSDQIDKTWKVCQYGNIIQRILA